MHDRDRDSVGGDCGSRYMNTSACIKGHLHVEIPYVLKLRGTQQQHPEKNPS